MKHSLLIQQLQKHQLTLGQCTLCPNMSGPAIYGLPIPSKVMLIGQAPGVKEADILRPFAWTAGKKLFSWFNDIGIDERKFRKNVYMSAICRCYPGKKKTTNHGDRVPDKKEIKQCAQWLQQEIDLLKPELIILVGKLAINEFMPIKKLDEVIGNTYHLQMNHHSFDVIPLPHPSGASTWPLKEPGKSLLKKAMSEINKHPSWSNICLK